MNAYLARRLLSMLPVLLIVSIVAFGLLSILPGDPALAIVGERGDQQTYLALRHELGLDQPLYQQYLSWLGRVLHGDFGRSVRTNESVATLLVQRIPVSLYVGFAGLLVGLVVSGAEHRQRHAGHRRRRRARGWWRHCRPTAEGGNSAYRRAHVPGLIDSLHQADAAHAAATRQSLFLQAQKLMDDSAWSGYIWFETGNFVVHTRIQGFLSPGVRCARASGGSTRPET